MRIQITRQNLVKLVTLWGYYVKKENIFFVIFILFLVSISTSCDPWSSYPPDDKFGQNEYDGQLTWNRVSNSNDWDGRYKHASTVYNNKLWIFGGYGYQGLKKDSYFEDVWYSSDGETWTLATDDAPWYGRTGHAVVVLNGKMLLIGGYAVDEKVESTHETNHYMHDVWESTDGENWSLVTDNAPFGARAYHAAIVVNVSGTDTIFVIGGVKNGTEYYDDIWKSTDGENWAEVSLTDDYREILGKRAKMAVASIGTDIYIQGGFTPDYEVAEVDQTDWKKIRKFNTITGVVEKKSRPDGGPYNNRALMKMVPYNGKFYLFSGVEIRREYSMDNDDVYSTWTYEPDTWSIDSGGSGFGPRQGYTAEIFDAGDGEKIWILGGWSYTGPKNDVWTAQEVE